MAFPSRQTASRYSAGAQKAAAALRKEKKALTLSPQVRAAIELMVFEGRHRHEAAKEVGLKDDSLRKALTKPDVLAHLNECQEVLRTSGRPRALRKMIQLIDEAKTERIQFEASKYIDGMDRPSHAVGATVNVQINQTVNIEKPGYVIDLREPERSAPQITHLEQDEDK